MRRRGAEHEGAVRAADAVAVGPVVAEGEIGAGIERPQGVGIVGIDLEPSDRGGV